MMRVRRKDSPKPGGAVFHVLALILVFIVLAGMRLAYPDLSHGDDHADSNMMIAGANFDRLGFTTLKFMCVQNPRAIDASEAYTHFPPAPEILNGLMRKFFSFDQLWQFRLVSLLVSLGGLLIFWWFAMELSGGSEWFATVAAALLLTHPIYLSLFDSLHQTPYTELFRAITCLLALKLATLEGSDSSRSRLLAGLWLCAFFNILFTFESVVFLWLFTVLVLLVLGPPRLKDAMPAILLVSSAPVVGFALRFALNAWYYGGISQAFGHFLDIAAIRAVGVGDVAGTQVTLATWWQNVFIAFVEEGFRLSFLALLVLALLMFVVVSLRGDASGRRILIVVALLAIAGVTWSFVMPAHSLAHSGLTFLKRHLLFAYAVFWAAAARSLFLCLPSCLPQRFVPLSLSVVAAVFVLMAAVGVFQSELPVTAAKQARELAFRQLAEKLVALQQTFSPSAVVATNYFRQPFISYYTNRQVLMVRTPEMLSLLASPPSYFLLVPFGDEPTKQLTASLETAGYRPQFVIESQLLPFVVWKPGTP